jgi:hypothetical protein
MKKKNSKVWDDEDLLPEYDLESLPIIARGPGHRPREGQARQVTLDADVAEFFETDAAVNEALRTLIRICLGSYRFQSGSKEYGQ